MQKGIIVKNISNLYKVETENNIFLCEARGKFKKSGITPAVGDRVQINSIDEQKGIIEEVLERSNYIKRPKIANLTQIVFVLSMSMPKPDLLLLDKQLAFAEFLRIEPIICINKIDLEKEYRILEIEKIYQDIGYKVIKTNAQIGENVQSIKDVLKNNITAFSGNSGVGKSTILNAILPELELETGDISRKLGRGRHTTRHTELYKICGGYIADTPGFSTVDIERYELIRKEDLPNCFPEFEPYICNCKFTSCAHIKEKGCGVLEALNKGKISQSRHNSYVMMYDEVKDIKDWMNKS